MSAKKNVLNVRWFKEQIRAAKLSQRQIAFKMDIDPSIISHTFNGRRRMTFEEAVKWAELLGQPLSVVALNAGIDVNASAPDHGLAQSLVLGDIEVIGWVDGAFTVVMGLAKGPKRVPNPSPTVIDGTDLVALRCQTGGFMDGALLYYRNNPDPGAFYESLERSCVVKIAGGKTVVRAIKRGYEPGRFNLHGAFSGEMLEESVVVEWASPVIWMKL